MSDAPDESIARLRGDGLVLRTYVDTDVDRFVAATRESAESVGRWMPWARADYSTDEAIAWFAACRAARVSGDAYEYGLFDAVDGRFLGGAGLNRIDRAHRFCNLGYWVRASAQRRGVASGAVRLLLHEAFDNGGMRRVEIVVAVGNTASEGVARKAGGLFECIARNRVMVGDVSHAASVFSFVPP